MKALVWILLLSRALLKRIHFTSWLAENSFNNLNTQISIYFIKRDLAEQKRIKAIVLQYFIGRSLEERYRF